MRIRNWIKSNSSALLLVAFVLLASFGAFHNVIADKITFRSSGNTVSDVKTTLSENSHDFLATQAAIKGAIDAAISAGGNVMSALTPSSYGGTANWVSNASPGFNNLTAINTALSNASNGQMVVIPHGEWYVNGSITVPSSKQLKILQIGNVHFSAGNGWIFEGQKQWFEAVGQIDGGNSGGSPYTGYTGAAVYLRNLINSYINVGDIINSGVAIHLSGEGTGLPDGCQHNAISHGWLYFNHTAIVIEQRDVADELGNWNNATLWYNKSQIGRGITTGGGQFGIVFRRNANFGTTVPGNVSGADPMNGHKFYGYRFEGIDVAISGRYAGNCFFDLALEPAASRIRLKFDLEYATCLDNAYRGLVTPYANLVTQKYGQRSTFIDCKFYDDFGSFIGDRAYDNNGTIEIWGSWPYQFTAYNSGTANANFWNTTPRFPTVHAMDVKKSGAVRSVGWAKTFHRETGGAGTTILPKNIGSLEFNGTGARTFVIDVGDLAIDGEEFYVDYNNAAHAINFIRSDNSNSLIPSSAFSTGAGLYRFVWRGGSYSTRKLTGTSGATYTSSNGITQNGTDFKLGGPLTENTTISGEGTSQMVLNNLTGFYVSSASVVQLLGQVQLTSTNTSDNNYSTPANPGFIQLDQITANRTFTISGLGGSGKMIFVNNRNSSGFSWQLGTTVIDKDGSTLTSFANQTNYILVYLDFNWRVFMKY
jgi:hypothetical protein